MNGLLKHKQQQHNNESIHAGLRFELWGPGSSVSVSPPTVVKRLEPHTNLEFSLVDLFPNITAGDGYGVQVHGYMRLAFLDSKVRITHSHGQALLHLGHCLFQVSNAVNGAAEEELSKGTRDVIGSLRQEKIFHFQLTLTSVSHNELVQVLVPNVTAPEEAMIPMQINHDAYADVRMRTVEHDEEVVGDPGCFWMLHPPPEGVPRALFIPANLTYTPPSGLPHTALAPTQHTQLQQRV